MKVTPLRAALMASALVVMGAGASLAQPAPSAGPEHAAMRERPDPAAMAERRAQHLRDTLQLTPKQEPALQALIAGMKHDRPDRGEWRQRREENAKLTTPQRLDRMQAKMAERQTRFAQRAETIKRFYAQLSPSQQKAFDAMGPMGGRGRHMGGHGMGGAGKGGDGHGWDHGGDRGPQHEG